MRPPIVPPEHLGDVERVTYVLEAHDGRARRRTITRECRWPEAKTDTVLQLLDRRGAIERSHVDGDVVVTLSVDRSVDDQQ